MIRPFLILTALSIGIATTTDAAPKVHSQQAAATDFARLCLSKFPNQTHVTATAKKLGLTKVPEGQPAQSSSRDFTKTVVTFPDGKRRAAVKIDMNALGVQGWSSVTLSFSVKRADGSCVFLVSTPSKGLYNAVASQAARYGTPKVRVRAGGNAASITATINGQPAKIEVGPERLQGHRDFAVIKITRK